MSDMRRVDRNHKCPICDHDTWCLLGRSIVICMRIASQCVKHFKGGEVGYIHDYPNGAVERPAYRPTPKQVPSINASKVLRDWRRACLNDRLPILAHSLGVSIQSLEELGCQWACGYVNTWAFPMSDGYGNQIGIRLRNLVGQKWAVTGSHAGIFVPRIQPQRRLLVVEGPTDTAAAITLGYFAIGRPSCSGGVPHILAFVRRTHVSQVVIISDNDSPGIRGANDLQRFLEVPSCIMVLPTKDLREFISIGDKSTIDAMINQLVWTQPRKAA
jgi:hypothetical protein